MDGARWLLWMVASIGALLAGCAKVPAGPPSFALEGPWEHRFVELAGRGDDGAPLTMHYLAAGPADGPRVLLVHGFPDLSYGWRDVLPELAEDHRVLALDLRGYGGTDRPEGGYGIDSLAGDVAAFIEAAGDADGAAGPVHVIAHDWGAATCWWLATQRPELMLSYTAVSVPHPAAWTAFLAEDRAQRKRAIYQKQLAAPGVAGVFAGLSMKQLGRVYRGEMTHPEALTDAHLAVYARAFDTAADWGPPLRYYQVRAATAEAEAAAVAAAPPVAVPTLVLWGEQDSYVYARQAERSCGFVSPGPCEVTVFEDAGHFVHWDAPGALVERWRAFAPGVGAGRPLP